MKQRRRELDIFNLSFLDIISCGFGAVIMLILVSKTSDDIADFSKQQIANMLQTVVHLGQSIEELTATVSTLSDVSLVSSNESERLKSEAKQLSDAIAQQQQKQAAVNDTIKNLQLAQSTLKQAAISVPEVSDVKRDSEIGGIPVDSDYVIFIVDTSGSMQQIWTRVSQEIINVLNIHPQVKGFQILNDMGKTLISGYDGKWIPDTPRRRSNTIKLFKSWVDISNSSPVEGIDIALRKYAKSNIKTSIYVFGDDYTGISYDTVIADISRKNISAISGKRMAKIHSVGFISPNTTDRFGILMRELSKRNGGTFLALPL